MKIKLNSHPSFIPKSLTGIEYGFGLYCANEDLGDKHFSFIQKMVEKSNNFLNKHNLLKIKEHDLHFLGNSVNNIEYIQTRFPQFSKDLNFQLNVDTNFNKLLKTFSTLSYLVSDNRDFMANMFSSFENVLYSPVNEDTTIVISSQMDGKLANALKESLPKQKQLDFILFHELGHYIEHHCEKNEGTYMHNLIETIRDIKELSYANLIHEHDDYSIVNKSILTSLSRLPGEIYADTASLLLMRNKAIENSTFDKEDMLTTVLHIQNARTQENYEKAYPDDIDEIIPQFTHKTSIIMDLIYEKINNLENNLLTLEDINKICCDIKEIGMARAFHSLLKSNPMFIDQVDALIATEFDGEKYFINRAEFKNKAIVLESEIKELVGNQWIDDFNQKIQKAEPHKQLLGSRIIFNLGFNETDTKGNINLLSNDIIHNITSIRNKSINSQNISLKP